MGNSNNSMMLIIVAIMLKANTAPNSMHARTLYRLLLVLKNFFHIVHINEAYQGQDHILVWLDRDTVEAVIKYQHTQKYYSSRTYIYQYSYMYSVG